MRVVFTRGALGQIQETHDFIAQQNTRAAAQWVDRITRRVAQIEFFPRSGRQVPELIDPNILELIEGDWRIIYLVDELAQELSVLAVVWGKRPLSDNDLG